MICQQCFIEFTPKKTGYWRKRKFCCLRCYYDSLKGKKRVFDKKWRESISKAMKGKKFTDEHKRKIGLAHKGKVAPKLSKWNKKHSGKNSINWRGGISPILARVRQTKVSIKWRKSVFKRDKYTCVKCGKRGGKLQADHIKPFSLFPELRFKVSNGQTLCIHCHKIKTKKDWEMIRKLRIKFEV